MKRIDLALVVCAIVLIPSLANAQIRITEWAYQGAGGEFFELTNMGIGGVDLAGWTYSDESDPPAMFDLSAFGVVAPGESAVVAEVDAETFKTAWGLGPGFKVIGNLTPNLGRNDEINIFDGMGTLIDRLNFGDEEFDGSIRTRANNEGSGNPVNEAALGADNPLLWVSSFVGDEFGSYESIGGDVGNPGFYLVPEPTSLVLLALGAAGLAFRRRIV